MQKQRLIAAALITVCLLLAATGMLALSHVRAQRIEVSAEQIDATCETPDSPGCAALLNQIEPGA